MTKEEIYGKVAATLVYDSPAGTIGKVQLGSHAIGLGDRLPQEHVELFDAQK